jgi:hypothetical protein
MKDGFGQVQQKRSANCPLMKMLVPLPAKLKDENGNFE